MFTKNAKRGGFVLPAILCCLLIAGLSIRLLEPLLHRDRLRSVLRTIVLRGEIEAHNDALLKLRDLGAGDLPAASSSRYLALIGSESRTGWAFTETLLLRRKSGSWPERFPSWTKLAATAQDGNGFCASWSLQRDAAKGIAAAESCETLPPVELGDLFLAANLVSKDPLTIVRTTQGTGTFAVAGTIELSGELSIEADEGASVSIIALGNIRIEKLRTTKTLFLSVISLAGKVAVETAASDWSLCDGATIEGRPMLFLSSPISSSLLDRELDAPGAIGCKPELPAAFWRPVFRFGSIHG